MVMYSTEQDFELAKMASAERRARIKAVLETESQAVQDAARAVGGGGPNPLCDRVYELVRVMIEDSKRRETEEILPTVTKATDEIMNKLALLREDFGLPQSERYLPMEDVRRAIENAGYRVDSVKKTNFGRSVEVEAHKDNCLQVFDVWTKGATIEQLTQAAFRNFRPWHTVMLKCVDATQSAPSARANALIKYVASYFKQVAS